ncbi:molybdopterin-dependent oxidoreductase [Leucobacter coleopterorum]|uniref:Molybdopterin-dependent oxidoreductase n=1 Tax=Leucobacter coleopterorum TaxID=2714933 RepID=A0ABX6K0K6_9MICO|nr:molybdopterin-dependent oxidoreductase [Leucobacter coleopterorum]QIM18600.1 molybdopterin-dependent oxidoreductase [Leucobacter coleopterorum]
MRARLWAGALGVTAAAAVLATAELCAVFVSPQSSPVFAMGSLAIDLAPLWVKETMISLFGTGDKAALFVILGIVLLAVATVAGIVEMKRRHSGVIVTVVVSLLALLAVLTRAEATAMWALPTLLGMALGIFVMLRGRRLLADWIEAAGSRTAAIDPGDAAPSIATSPSRRSFVKFVALTSAAAVVVGIGSRLMNAGSAAVSAARSAIKLPKPALAAPPVPAGAELNVPGITPLFTPNDEFYRIDIALQVPRIDPADWELRITGLVDHPFSITYDELLALPLEEHVTTIACVSNEVGGDLIGNATWLGYPIRDLLAKAGPAADADMVLSSGPDGFTAGTPLETLTDPKRAAILAVGMNGEPLPTEHGFPARMIVPGLFGYVSATKWITTMEVTRFADAEGYWTPRGWSALGPVKTAARIDTPRPSQRVGSGTATIAGVAWAQHTGIKRVEVQIDEGEWQEATLATALSDDTWVQWSLPWNTEPGSHTARVRATDKSGKTQTETQAPPAPDGATGWHTVSFTV